MKFAKAQASVFVPDSVPEAEALRRITHLAIGAHQDDIEIMALDGVFSCFQASDQWFGAVTCTDGSGSPRSGQYAAFSDAQMAALRRREQEKAAIVGDYGLLVQLDYTSAEVKAASNRSLAADLAAIVRACRPDVVYTHNLADKHDTHVAVALSAVRALRSLAADERPRRVLGCEVWRGLDWLLDEEKVALNVTGHDTLAAALIGVHDSQVAGGKRYDLATAGRRRANATYYESHATDEAEGLWFAMDLTPLVHNAHLDAAAFVGKYLDDFRNDVIDRLQRLSSWDTASRG
jgi:LmbE family N-acetylglucosaminyl deacetylase